MNKQIEEIANIIKAVKYEPFNYGKPTYTVGNQMQDFVFDLIAEEIIKQGYQKVGKDSVIISKAELNQIQSNFFDSGIKQARKETAREILNEVGKVCADYQGLRIYANNTVWRFAMKVTTENELKYGMACRVCQEKAREDISPNKRKYYIGCPFRHIDNEYCPTIEAIDEEERISINKKEEDI